MALTSRQFQWICFECLFLTSACVTITSSGSFENGTEVELTCINQPYSDTQIWRMNTVEVLSCGVTSCAENVSNPGRFSFVNDISNGVFVFTIDPILFTDDGSVVGCQDGTTEKTFNINVKDPADTQGNENGGLGQVYLVVIISIPTICVCFCCFYCRFCRAFCCYRWFYALIPNKGKNKWWHVEATSDTRISVYLYFRWKCNYRILYKEKNTEDGWSSSFGKCTIEGLKPSTVYEVKPFLNEQPYSYLSFNKREVQTQGVVQARQFHFCGITDTSATLTWLSGCTRNISYVLMYKRRGEENWEKKPISVNACDTEELIGLEPDSEYLAIVKVDAESAEIVEIPFRTKVLVKIPVVFECSVENITDSTVTLKWKTQEHRKILNSPIQKYLLKYKTANEKNWKTKDIPVDRNDIIRQGLNRLKPRSKYSVKVNVVTSNGESETSEICFQTLGTPMPPKNFHFQSTDTRISLSWNARYDGGLPQKFRLCWKEQSAKRWTSVEDIPVVKKTYNLSELKPKTKYQFKLCASNEYGHSTERNLEVITHGKPDPPENFVFHKHQNRGNITTSVAWDPGRSKKFYMSIRSESDQMWRTEIEIEDIKKPFPLDNLEQSNQYELKMYAYDSKYGNSEDRIMSVNHGLLDIPHTFQCLAAKTDTSVTFTWKKGYSNADIQKYILQFKKIKAKNWSKKEIPKLNDDMEYKINNLDQSTKYSAKVCAVIGGRESDFTTEIYFETRGTIEAPMEFRTVEITDSTVKLFWKKGYSKNSIYKYILKYKNALAKNWISEDILVDISNPHVIEHRLHLGRSSQYSAKVRAVSKDGESYFTEEIDFQTHGEPDPPENFTFQENKTTNKSISMTWDPGYDGGRPQSFYICCKKESEKCVGTWFPATKIEDFKKSYTKEGLEPLSQYEIKLYARNMYGESLHRTLQVQTHGEPSPPENFTFHDNKTTDTMTFVSWDPGFDGGVSQSFHLYFKKECDETWSQITTQDGRKTHTQTGMSPSTQYVFKLYARNDYGKSEERILQVKTHGKPDPPRNVHAYETTDTTISVSWDPGFDGGRPQKFYLRFKKMSDKEWSHEATTTVTSNTHTRSRLEPSTMYEINLHAQNTYGISIDSYLQVKTHATGENTQLCCRRNNQVSIEV